MKNIALVFILFLSYKQALNCQNTRYPEIVTYNCEVYNNTSIGNRSMIELPGLNFKINLDTIDYFKSNLIQRDSARNQAFSLYTQNEISKQTYDSISINYGVPVFELDSMLYWLISYDTIKINSNIEQLLAFEVKPNTDGSHCLENSFSAAFVYLINFGVVYYTYPFEQDYYFGTTYEIGAIQIDNLISVDEFKRLRLISEAMTTYKGYYSRKYR